MKNLKNIIISEAQLGTGFVSLLPHLDWDEKALIQIYARLVGASSPDFHSKLFRNVGLSSRVSYKRFKRLALCISRPRADAREWQYCTFFTAKWRHVMSYPMFGRHVMSNRLFSEGVGGRNSYFSSHRWPSNPGFRSLRVPFHSTDWAFWHSTPPLPPAW
jgi:hypothetical protein